MTPKGERVIDFGQNLTGYVSFSVNGKLGDRIAYSHAEVLDADGNFYTENLRSAKQKVEYICCEGKQEYKPHHTFMGFRYIRLDEAPEYITPDMFEAIVVHSDIRRTGYFECSDKKINKLYQNIIWGQKGNFLDVPTDCPQRDERLGWTGDAQVFVKTASYNYDVKKFFGKWLQDLSAEQRPDGAVPQIVPDVLPDFATSSGWGDAVTICPWQLYLFYGTYLAYTSLGWCEGFTLKYGGAHYDELNKPLIIGQIWINGNDDRLPCRRCEGRTANSCRQGVINVRFEPRIRMQFGLHHHELGEQIAVHGDGIIAQI